MNEKYRLTIFIDAIPESLNVSMRTHYFQYNSKKKFWNELVRMHCINKLPKEPLKKAHLKITMHFWRMLYYDGFVGSLKPVVDALIYAGVISDDRWSVVGKWDVDQVYRPKKDGPLLKIEIFEE